MSTSALEHDAPCDIANTSGTPGPVPVEVVLLGWCWGGFALTWLWGLANRVYVIALVLLAAPMVGDGHWFGATVVRWCVPPLVAVYLGLQGHRLAWRHRRFASVRQFEETMTTWDANARSIFLVAVPTFALLALAGVVHDHYWH